MPKIIHLGFRARQEIQQAIAAKQAPKLKKAPKPPAKNGQQRERIHKLKKYQKKKKPQEIFLLNNSRKKCGAGQGVYLSTLRAWRSPKWPMFKGQHIFVHFIPIISNIENRITTINDGVLLTACNINFLIF